MKLSANDIVLKVLGLLLLVAASFKGYELLTEPVANADIWSNRNFLIFTVEFELALGIWLLSGLFKKLAWLAATACFSVFCSVTLYKALAGYGSCGCFGKVDVSPWITLLIIDMPAVIILILVKPKNICNTISNEASIICSPLVKRNFFAIFKKLAKPKLAFVSFFTILLILASSVVLAMNEPAMTTSSYEVLEPEMWVDKELPILEHIDIADKITTGNWLLLLYHHDCPDCQKTIAEYKKMATDILGNEDFLRIALVEIPPYGYAPIDANTNCTLGKLNNSKKWFIRTPASLLFQESKVKLICEEKALTREQVFNYL